MNRICSQLAKMSCMLLRILLLCLVVNSCSLVNSKGPSRLVSYKLPKGYVEIKSEKHGSAFIKEFVPSSESSEHWTNMIRYVYQPTDADVGTQFKEMADAIGKICEDPFVPRPFTGTIGGEPALNGLTACGTNSAIGKGEISQYVMIRDKSGIHSIQKTVRVASFNEADAQGVIRENLKTWNDFFQTVKF